MNIKQGFGALLSAMCLSVSAHAATQTADESGIVQVGDSAPLFEGDTIKGEHISLSNYSGKVVVLDFFATW